MTMEQLLERACLLEKKIRVAPECDRLDYQPEFDRVLGRIKAAGLQVPAHLRRTELALMEEMIERQFDNMPV